MEDLARINGKKSRKGLWISLVVIVILLIGAGVGG